MRPDIQTASGRFFNFHFPELSHITVDDIAHALSHLCRYTGHCREFYSVAQHAYLCSFLVPPEHAFAALHHDDAEAFIGDVASPLKRLLPEYKRIEKRVEASIFKMLGLPPEIAPEVKHADLVMLATEKRDLMPHAPRGTLVVDFRPEVDEQPRMVEFHRDDPWAILVGIEPAALPIHPVPPKDAKRLFLERHIDLSRTHRNWGMAQHLLGVTVA